MNKLIIGVVVGLVVGLVLGIAVYPVIHLPTQNGTGTNNQVTVSGYVKEENPSEISFSSIFGSKQSVETSGLITNGDYSVVLVGNQSYTVTITYQPQGYYSPTSTQYSIYVPLGTNYFNANF
ncbi:MAG: hypothetical protein ABSA75_04260 [Candidatus Bathyarchaeia archaeon]|jgi:hypothetical protein